MYDLGRIQSDESVAGRSLRVSSSFERLTGIIERLETAAADEDADSRVSTRRLRSNHHRLFKQLWQEPNAWEIVQLARHPRRPRLHDYLETMVTDFCELHGDRCYGDDLSIVTGLGRVGAQRFLIVGHNKGRTLNKRTCHNFGSPLPEGYRKALAKMKLAEKYGIPILCLVDTPGAHPGIEAESRGQARAIALNLREMSRIRVPTIVAVVGEGGSGGALAIGVGDRVAIMQYAYLSVISPEGCAAILAGDAKAAPAAAEALRLTSQDAVRLGCADTVIPEPLGGAHCDPSQASRILKRYILRAATILCRYEISELVEKRYARLRTIGDSFVGSNCSRPELSPGLAVSG